MSQIEPGDREEMLLQGILNGDTESNIEPGSRKEMLLKAILENGGKTYYQHNILLKLSESNATYARLTVISQDNTPFTTNTLAQWLIDNGFKASKRYPACGQKSGGEMFSSVYGSKTGSNYSLIGNYFSGQGTDTQGTGLVLADDIVIEL